MSDERSQKEPESESTKWGRFIPAIPASSHKTEADLALTGGWDQPWPSGWGFQAMVVRVGNPGANDLKASFDGGTTYKTIRAGEEYTWTRRNDDGHAFAIQGTSGQPYEVDVQK